MSLRLRLRLRLRDLRASLWLALAPGVHGHGPALSAPSARTRATLRRWRPVAVGAAMGLFLLAALLIGGAAFAATPIWATLAAMALYLAAHALRAARLAIIAAPLLGISARTAGLLHFACAPFVTLLPLKLGELVRLHQLWIAGRRLPGAVIALLIDRTLDAAMLLALLAWLALAGRSLDGGATTVLWLTALAVGTAGAVFVLGPRALENLQRYVLIHHQRRALLRGLAAVDMLRRGADEGGALMRSQGAPLLLMSAMIWGLELGAAALFATNAIAPELQDPALLLVTRTTQEWRAATASGVDPALAASAATSLLALLAVWPAALHVYMQRLGAEPLRRPQERGPLEDAHGA